MRIMAVDDEPGVLAVVKAIMEPLGAEVLTTSDSREAAGRLDRERFDAILVDAVMPHLNGFEFTRRARGSALNSNTPIVMVTGFDDVRTMKEGFKAGITFFLGKPLDAAKMRGLFNAMRGAVLRERRRHLRLPFHTSVDCQFGSKHFKATSVDLGGNGMALEPSGGLVEGQVFDVEFTLPGVDHALKIGCRILRKEPPDRVAVEFVDLSAPNKEALRNYFSGLVKKR